MHLENLVSMANQIGTFFSAYPDRQEALDGIATHIHKFWEPRMRTRLLDALAKGEVKELMPLVNDALLANQAKLRPLAAYT
ncbi:MAG: formate dehydrogenase [Betaproteobacteria bacterium]|nr:formate dehydrogenase [Betaproteobacteria bacterium]